MNHPKANMTHPNKTRSPFRQLRYTIKRRTGDQKEGLMSVGPVTENTAEVRSHDGIYYMSIADWLDNKHTSRHNPNSGTYDPVSQWNEILVKVGDKWYPGPEFQAHRRDAFTTSTKHF